MYRTLAKKSVVESNLQDSSRSNLNIIEIESLVWSGASTPNCNLQSDATSRRDEARVHLFVDDRTRSGELCDAVDIDNGTAPRVKFLLTPDGNHITNSRADWDSLGKSDDSGS